MKYLKIYTFNNHKGHRKCIFRKTMNKLLHKIIFADVYYD